MMYYYITHVKHSKSQGNYKHKKGRELIKFPLPIKKEPQFMAISKTYKQIKLLSMLPVWEMCV